jgi:hypothetical protein
MSVGQSDPDPDSGWLITCWEDLDDPGLDRARPIQRGIDWWSFLFGNIADHWPACQVHADGWLALVPIGFQFDVIILIHVPNDVLPVAAVIVLESHADHLGFDLALARCCCHTNMARM